VYKKYEYRKKQIKWVVFQCILCFICLSIREQRISAVIGFSNASTAPKNESRNKNFNEFLNLPNAVSKKNPRKKKII
jgi:hypothetical protein